MKSKEEIKQYKKEWAKKNKEKIKKRQSKWYFKNKKRISSEGIIYRKSKKYKHLKMIYNKKNKEMIRKIKKNWVEKNKKHIKETRKKWYEKNKEKILKYHTEYRKINRKKIECQRLAVLHISIPKGQVCKLCRKKTATIRHHFDYSKPLEITFCCNSCHTLYHKEFDICPNKKDLERWLIKIRNKNLKPKWKAKNL